MVAIEGRTLQYIALSAGSLSALSCGFHLGWPGPYLQQLVEEDSAFPVTDSEGSWIAISFLIGAFCGSGLCVALLDWAGRRRLVIFTNFPFVASWLMVAFAGSWWELCAARFVAGLSDGMVFCAVPLYFSEVADAKVRGLFVSGLIVMHLTGVLFMAVVGSFLPMKSVALFCVSVPLIVFLTFLWLPETPHYYVVRGDLENARRSLRKLTAKVDVEPEIGHILETMDDCDGSKGKLLNFISNGNSRRGIVILLLIRTVQQFSGYVAFVFYLPAILTEASDFVSPVISTSIYYTLQMTFALISMVTIDRVGRKPILVFSVASVTLSLSVVGVYFLVQGYGYVNLKDYSWIPLLGLFLFISGYSSGLHSIPVLLVGEIFPIGVKVLAITLFDMYYSIVSSIASKFFQYTKDEFGMYVPFLTFACCCACGLPFIVHFLPETKNKTLEEIQIEGKLKIKA
ncbi:facilitated trehalose transporter Tret1-like [Photinus pyralis]|nr:facilitated trehalose transporter Tret1-like [Photinus pyralis]XP_031355760.1 facilitated trehalose transporter Tret1-like [Photinus pyralis]